VRPPCGGMASRMIIRRSLLSMVASNLVATHGWLTNSKGYLTIGDKENAATATFAPLLVANRAQALTKGRAPSFNAGAHMAHSLLFLVLAFRQTGNCQYRVDAAIRVPSAERARLDAAQLAECGRGTVAFSIAGDPSIGAWDDAKILARFGNVPDDCALRESIVPA
jgi:hypothetical protein